MAIPVMDALQAIAYDAATITTRPQSTTPQHPRMHGHRLVVTREIKFRYIYNNTLEARRF